MIINQVPLASMRLAPGDSNMNTQDLKGRLTSILLEDIPLDKKFEYRSELNLVTESDEILAPKLNRDETLYGSDDGQQMTKTPVSISGNKATVIHHI